MSMQHWVCMTRLASLQIKYILRLSLIFRGGEQGSGPNALTAVVLDAATGSYRGKQTHEVSLFRQIDGCVEEGDVFLADRASAGWFDMARMI